MSTASPTQSPTSIPTTDEDESGCAPWCVTHALDPLDSSAPGFCSTPYIGAELELSNADGEPRIYGLNQIDPGAGGVDIASAQRIGVQLLRLVAEELMAQRDDGQK